MKGILIEKAKTLRVVELPDPVPQPGKAIIRISLCGICGSDVAAYGGTSPVVRYPVVIGHESVGTIEQIEDNGRGFQVGDRVLCEPVTFCGKCYPCRQGRTNNCENISTCGVHRPGMMSELFQHDISKLHKIPDNLTDEQAAMVEPLTIGLHATHRIRPQKEERCVVTGAGTIGLMSALAARAYGAEAAIVDTIPSRLEKARSMGLEKVINPAEEDVFQALRDWNNGELPALLYECTGASPVVERYYDYVVTCGRVVMVGWPHEDLMMDMTQVIRKELDIFGARNSIGCFPEAVELISTGKVKVDGFVSAVVPMEKADAAYRELEERPQDYIKVLVNMQ